MIERELSQSTFKEKESERLSALFKKTDRPDVFLEIEKTLYESGFSLANENMIAEVLNTQNILCRSESFEKVIDVLTLGKDINITNENDEANMCIMASGIGLKTAMIEGFAGKEVAFKVKVVITFKKDHLIDAKPLDHHSRLWDTKRETAEVSLKGRGKIVKDDIVMVSMRFPIQYFPHTFLTEREQEDLDEEKISFVVRHYLPKTMQQTLQ